MNVARFNFSHGDHATHCKSIFPSLLHPISLFDLDACLTRLREAQAARPNKFVAVMLDTKGPEIRTGTLDSSLGGKLTLHKGQTIEVGTDYARPGDTNYLRKRRYHLFSIRYYFKSM